MYVYLLTRYLRSGLHCNGLHIHHEVDMFQENGHRGDSTLHVSRNTRLATGHPGGRMPWLHEWRFLEKALGIELQPDVQKKPGLWSGPLSLHFGLEHNLAGNRERLNPGPNASLHPVLSCLHKPRGGRLVRPPLAASW